MARDVESLVLMMSADVRRMEKALDQGQRKFDRTADAIERRQRQLDRNLANLGREAGNFAQPVQAASAVALGAIIGFSVQAARRAEAVNGAFAQTFRDLPSEAQAAVSEISSEFGRLETDVKDNFTQLRSVLTALGVDAAQSLDIVDQLQRRSLDIAAFRDVSDAEAFRAVISGITGETEPLKRFGIIVNETATKAELLRLGFKGNASEASEAAKSIARTNIILRQSGEMQGQVARESESLAEQEKRTRKEFTEAAEDFGHKFLPVAKEVLVWATDALEAFNNLPEGTQAAALGLLALVAASGPIAAVIGGLRSLIAAAVAARAAIAAVGASGGAGAAAGVAGGAAARAGAGAALGAAARAAGPVTLPLLVGGDTPQRRLEGQERINAQLAEEARVTGVINRLRREGNEAEAERQEQYRQRIRSDRELRQGLAEIARPSTPQEAADEAARAALASMGDFGLSDAQRTATGGGGGSGGRRTRASGPTAAELAAQREMLRLQGQAEILQAQGRDAEAAMFQRRIDIINLTKTFTEAGIADATAAATAQVDAIARGEAAQRAREAAAERTSFILEAANDALAYQNELAMERVQFEAELARLSGDPVAIQAKERELYIAERVNHLLEQRKGLITEAQARELATGEFNAVQDAERRGDLRDGAQDAARTFIDVIRSENIWEAAGQRFRDVAFDNLENLFASIFRHFGEANGGIGNLLTSLLPKRALGGPVMAGRPVLVGERRPEVFVPNANGTIIPNVNAATARVQSARAYVQTPVVKIFMDEGGLFAPRVQQISGPVAVQTTAAGVAFAQDRTQQAARRRRQSFVT